MLIISWNVAGLSPLLQRVHDDYCTESVNYANKDASNKDEIRIKPKLPRNHAFSHYLRKHGSPDVLCLQEHKIPKHKLSSRSEPFGCAYLDGYESFWSCCVDPKRKGFNGVVTYAKIGTVQYASSTPFNNPSLDDQGRCILTDHGHFVLFNVYVPCTTISNRMEFLEALKNVMDNYRVKLGRKVILVGDINVAHRRSLRRQRDMLRDDDDDSGAVVGEEGEMMMGGNDTHWTYRKVLVDKILEAVQRQKNVKPVVNNIITNIDNNEKELNEVDNTRSNKICNDITPSVAIIDNNAHRTNNQPPPSLLVLPKWALDLDKHWDSIEDAMSTAEAIPVQTKNIATGKTFDKYRVRVRVRSINNNTSSNNNDKHEQQQSHIQQKSQPQQQQSKERFVLLGQAESNSHDALSRFDFTPKTYFDTQSKNERVLLPSNAVPIEILIELMKKVAGVTTWDDDVVRSILNGDGGCDNSDWRHNSWLHDSSPGSEWMDRIMGCEDNDENSRDGMVDAFRYLYPSAKDRFTCWNQRTNERYKNKGARIDYTLVDASLAELIANEGNNTNIDESNCVLRCLGYPRTEQNSAAAALHAATAGGLLGGASFGGGGIALESRKALESQFGVPHTGIIYTPPSYSDHVAVSLLLQISKEITSSCEPIQLLLRVKDPNVRRSQPHKSQASIAGFFLKKDPASVPSAKKKKILSNPKKNSDSGDGSKTGLLRHFSIGKMNDKVN